MEINKTTTKHYTVLDVTKDPFMTFGTLRYIREKNNMEMEGLRTCFNCDHKFNDKEDIFLAIIKGKKNKFLCEKCKNEALKDIKK